MATIKDIAREAGISYMTVSNVINNRTDKVSQETIDKVNKIIDKLGYTPNMYARSLVRNSSQVVAYINTIKLGISDPFNAIFIDALEHSLSKNNYYLMVKTIFDPEVLRTFLKSWKVDGMCFVGLCNNEMFEIVRESKISTIFVDSYLSCSNARNIILEDYNGAFSACEYLIKNGHTKIAFVAPAFNGGVNELRLDGTRAALMNHNIPFHSDMVFDLRDYKSAFDLGCELAAKDITAVFCFSDIIAINVMNGIKYAGKHVPEDISIIGFDDIETCKFTSPALTTIHQDIYKKGEIAVEQFISMQKKTSKSSSDRIILPTRLVERGSVKCLL